MFRCFIWVVMKVVYIFECRKNNVNIYIVFYNVCWDLIRILVICLSFVLLLVLKWLNLGLLIFSILSNLLFIIRGIIIFELDVVLYVIWFEKVCILLICWMVLVFVVVLYIFLFIGICMYVGWFWNGFSINWDFLWR